MDAWLNGRRDRASDRLAGDSAAGGRDHQPDQEMIMRSRPAGGEYCVNRNDNQASISAFSITAYTGNSSYEYPNTYARTVKQDRCLLARRQLPVGRPDLSVRQSAAE